LTKGRITILSLLAAENGFVRPRSHIISFLELTSLSPLNGISIGSTVFSVHHSNDSQCFSTVRTTPKIAPSPWGTGTPTHGSLNPPESAPKTTSKSVQLSAHLVHMPNTHYVCPSARVSQKPHVQI